MIIFYFTIRKSAQSYARTPNLICFEVNRNTVKMFLKIIHPEKDAMK
jgi:hypothetical protein